MRFCVSKDVVRCSIGTTPGEPKPDFPAKLQPSSFSTVKFRPDNASSDLAVSSSSRRGLICIATLPCVLPLVTCLPANAMQPGAKEYLLIKEEVRKVVSKGKAAGVLRLVFHDAGTFDTNDNTGGMNGSVVYELERPENAGLKKSVLQKAKTQIDAIQPVSWADMIAVAGAEAVEVCGGPPIQVSLGRLDALVPDPERRLPEESLGASDLKKCFQRKGFSTQELVALSGAHTLGSKGFGSPISFDNSYYKVLLEKPWTSPGAGCMLDLATGSSHDLCPVFPGS
ncbi:hypothetical protein Fmac_000711 [Flemingia macrophylla]|uniref:L-ascorbate peroxidase n=1 Tax=Flemingia macrophylla TaxID=520843 RepID=A0ABD1NFI8_9FABA